MREELSPKPRPLELLPNELLNIIFEDFHQDISSLKACSLVSQTLRTASQPHIFHTVALEFIGFNTDPGPIFSHSRFLDTISASPYLASQVRELKFVKPRKHSTSMVRVQDEERVVHQKVVAQILATLPELTCLVLRNLPSLLIWSRMSLPLAKALSQVVLLPTLRHLDLGVTWEFPLSFFARLAKIESLRFADLNMSLDKFNPGGHSEPEPLRSVSILLSMPYSSIDALFLCPTRLFDITRLQSLTFSPHLCEATGLRQILKICGPSLHTFKMRTQYIG